MLPGERGAIFISGVLAALVFLPALLPLINRQISVADLAPYREEARAKALKEELAGGGRYRDWMIGVAMKDVDRRLAGVEQDRFNPEALKLIHGWQDQVRGELSAMIDKQAERIEALEKKFSEPRLDLAQIAAAAVPHGQGAMLTSEGHVVPIEWARGDTILSGAARVEVTTSDRTFSMSPTSTIPFAEVECHGGPR